MVCQILKSYPNKSIFTIGIFDPELIIPTPLAQYAKVLLQGVIKTENSLVQQCTYGEIYNNIDQYFPPVKKGVPELEVVTPPLSWR